MITNWSAPRRPGSGRKNTPLTRVTTARLTPMPRASVSTETTVKPGFFSNWRKANLRSFITQRLHRIDFRRTSGRQPPSEQRNEQENQGDADERHWVGRFDLEKQCPQKASRAQRNRDAKPNAKSRKLQSLPQQQAENIPELRSQRHAHTDFM